MSKQSIARHWRSGINPIVVKEIRSRMRGGRAFILLTGFLLGLGVIGYGLFLQATGGEQYGQPLLSAKIGQNLFAGSAFALLFLVCLIGPAVTVGMISSERERLTYEMLVATSLSPQRLLWGKLIASLSYVALLLIAAIPLGSIVYLFGGITLGTVVKVAAIIGATAITASMLGLWASALFGRTGRAAVVTYLFIGIVLGGLLFSTHLWTQRSERHVPLALLTPNPISALASALGVVSGPKNPWGGKGDIATSWAGPGFGQNFNQGLSFPGWNTFSTGIYPPAVFDPMVVPTAIEARSTWRTTLVIESMICVILFWLSLHAVRPRRRWRVGWDDLVMLSLTCCTLAGLGFWRGWWLR